ncbi:hypothetical protein LG296_06645 [Ureibacillus chungkukjangi]|uniref:hypothetical protein n=1 Tax=Ureibacillus chungkukjangi TaxID=1202712 RepID=UPI00384B91E4
MEKMQERLNCLLESFREEFKEMFELKELFLDGVWVEIKCEKDIDEKIKHYSSLYLIATDCKFDENPCKLVYDEKYKVIYRGEGYNPKIRIKSHLFNNSYIEQGKKYGYEKCMKVEPDIDGINLDDPVEGYQNFKWYVYQMKLKVSSSIRKQAELAFDDAFNTPLASRDRNKLA